MKTMHYSIEPRDLMFVKDYDFFSFTKTMSNNIGSNINKNLSAKYGQKLLDDDKQCATDELKTASKKQFNNKQKKLVI